MTVLLDQFVQSLRESGLMTAEEVEAFLESLPPEEVPQNGKELAKLLFGRGKLTQFQAQAVYQGKTRGLVLGNYVVLDKIGQGGMGQVFQARHRRMDRVVALKMLPAAMNRVPRLVARFQQEVKAAAKLVHPNIVVAHDADESQGLHFLVMEYVAGRDLASVVAQRGPLPIGRVINYVLQAARGLQYAHEAGVVHRDVKPSNLLLDKSETVKILDLGLARLERQVAPERTTSAPLTETGQAMGTIDYMSPEQIESSHDVDQRADIYSLGCTLHYLLTGRSVYPADSWPKKAYAHCQAPIPSLPEVRADVPQNLNALFQKMLAKRPADRPADMAQVIAELETCQAALRDAIDETATFVAGSSKGDETQVHPPRTESRTPERSAVLDSDWLQAMIPEPPAPMPTQSEGGFTDRQWQILGTAVTATIVLALIVAVVVIMFSISRANKGADDGNPIRPENWINLARQACAEQWGVPPDFTNQAGMQFVLIPPGEFDMGSSREILERELQEARQQDLPDCYAQNLHNEEPQRRVTLTKAFYLSVYEVTQQQYQDLMGRNPSQFQPAGELKDNVAGLDTGGHPVENVRWFDVVDFCNRLSAAEGLQPYYRLDGETVTILGGAGYRLPTEAEWEYACRAGTRSRWYCGDSESTLASHAWHRPQSDGCTHRVGGLSANPFGLYDMHGNVWEWCQDWHGPYGNGKEVTDPGGPQQGTKRTLRGGSFNELPPVLRSACRESYEPTDHTNDLGFRPARSCGG